MLEPTIPLEKMQEFERDYIAGKFPHQRFGQAFCNHFNIHSSVLFYMEDEKKVRFIAWLNFVNCEERFLGE